MFVFVQRVDLIYPANPQTEKYICCVNVLEKDWIVQTGHKGNENVYYVSGLFIKFSYGISAIQFKCFTVSITPC